MLGTFTLFNYLEAVVVRHWLPLLFGILASAPWWIRALFPVRFQKKFDKYLNPSGMKKLAIICIIISFIWANFQAMKYQNNIIYNLKHEIFKLNKTAEETKPKFIGKIPYIILGKISDGTTNIMIFIEITNYGAPSIAQKWRLSINNNKLHLSGIMPINFPDNYKLYDNDQKVIAEFINDDAIWEKTTMTAIQPGIPIRGWLRFIVNDKKDDVYQPFTKIVINFNDYLGNTYEAQYIESGQPVGQPLYYPGTRYPFKKLLK